MVAVMVVMLIIIDDDGGHSSHQDHLYLGAVHHVLVLRDGVGHHHSLEAGVVDPLQGGAGEDAVGEDCVDLGGPGLQQLAGGQADGAAGVRHVVHQDGHPVLGAGVTLC